MMSGGIAHGVPGEARVSGVGLIVSAVVRMTVVVMPVRTAAGNSRERKSDDEE